ncbi:MAG: putative Ig domain-containing protein [Planctomycetota bacterium]|nr:putative Ig domain-containing protein [Planctomycetota bacterium]
MKVINFRFGVVLLGVLGLFGMLVSGCGSSSSTATPEVVIAPCDLAYPVDLLVIFCGIPITVQIPTVDCGIVTTWEVSPALPEGVVFNASDGSISGTALVAGSDQIYTVTASNEGGSSSFSVQVRVESPAVSPSGLSYPANLSIVPAGVPMSPLVPSVDCGEATFWNISPALPDGLTFDLSSGTISGTAVSNGHDQEHTIEAGNGVGSTTTTIRLRVDPIFTYSASTGPGTYSGVTGEGQISATLKLEEDSINPSYPTFIAAFNLAISNDPTELVPVTADPASFIQDINGGTGPSFWFTNMQNDQVVVAAVLFFADPSTVQFEVDREIALIEYDTIPSSFIDQTDPVHVSLQWQEDSPYTPTTSDMLIVADSAEGTVPVGIDSEGVLIRND